MAHELLIGDDGKASMFYVGGAPWHGLGQPLDHPPTAAEAIQAANLDWDVVKAPLFYHASIEATGVVPNLYALVPGARWPHKDRPLFGTATGKYEVLQNRDAFAFFDPVVSREYATYETAGALGQGERVWVMVRLREDFEVGKGDVVQRYILLSNSHDGEASVQVKFTPVRVVCSNTLTMALADGRETFAVRHDPSLFDNLGAVADEMIRRIEERYGLIKQGFLKMLDIKLREGMVARYLGEVFPDPPQPGTRDESRIYERLLKAARRDRWACARILEEGMHASMGRGTVWALYNAATEYVDHWRPAASQGRDAAVDLSRIWFGAGYRKKCRAYECALQLCKN